MQCSFPHFRGAATELYAGKAGLEQDKSGQPIPAFESSAGQQPLGFFNPSEGLLKTYKSD